MIALIAAAKKALPSWPQKLGFAVLLTLVISGCGFVDEGVNKNEPPLVGDDNYGVKEGEVLDVAPAQGVLANDNDAGGASLTARLIQGPAHVVNDTFVLNADGSFTYKHNGGETTQDQFSYVANDGVSDSEVKIAVITISPVNDPPVITAIRNDPFNSAEDALIDLGTALLVDDPDNDYPDDFSFVYGPTVNYTASGKTITPAANYFGDLSVSVTVNDGSGPSNEFNFTITVTPVNDAPTINAQNAVSMPEDMSRTIVLGDLSVDDVDNPPGDFQLSVAEGANYTINGNTVSPAADYNGSLTVPVTVSDGNATSAPFNMVVTVDAVNDSPEFISTPVTAGLEGVPYTYNADATDADVGDVITYSLQNAPNGMSIDPATGVITWLPSNANVGANAVVVTATDTTNLQQNQSFTVTVANVNGPPVINLTLPPPATATQGVQYTYDVNAADDDAGDTLTYSLPTAPAGMTINPVNGLITWTPTADQVPGPHNVTIVVTDSFTATATHSYAITVNNVNDPPSIVSTEITTATQGQLYTYDVNATDADASDTLTYSLSVSPAGMVIDANTGIITWTPAADQVPGPHAVTVVVTDSATATDSQMFNISVTNVNDPPTINSVAVTTAGETVPYSYTVAATDPDTPVGEVLSYSLSAAPTGMVINSVSGVISWTPAVGQGGNHTVTVVVSDDEAPVPATGNQTFTLVVNRQPVIDAIPSPQNAVELTAYSYDVNASDLDAGSVLTFSLTTAPAGMSIASDTGIISWTPPVLSAGDHTVTVAVADNGTPQLSASATFTVAVVTVGSLSADSGAPVLQPASAADSGAACWSTPQEQTLNATLVGEPSLSAPLTYRLQRNANNGDVTIEPTGQFTYTPLTAAVRGRDTFDYVIEDITGRSIVKTATVFTHLKVMPLGDSVTTGVINATDAFNLLPSASQRAGYRQPLYDALNVAGYDIDFVGSQTHGADVTPAFDSDNEGHEGWSTLELALGATADPNSGIYYWLSQNPADIILLHTGTDVPETSTDNIAALLDAIDRWEADADTLVTVLIARIINEIPANPEIVAYNNAIQNLVNSRFAAGDDILAVDIHSALLGLDGQPDPSLYGDALHPNTAGYQSMADQWFLPLTSVLEKCPQ